MKSRTIEGIGCYVSNPESGGFELSDGTTLWVFEDIGGLDYQDAGYFEDSCADIDEQIRCEREYNAILDRDSPMGDGSSWHSEEIEEYTRRNHAEAVKFVERYRAETGRKYPPVYRVKVQTEVEEVSAEDAERYWLDRAEKQKWWKAAEKDDVDV